VYTPYVPDLDAMERELLAKLEAGGGSVSAEFWQPFLRELEDEDSIGRLESAARAWRRQRGMNETPFVFGSAD